MSQKCKPKKVTQTYHKHTPTKIPDRSRRSREITHQKKKRTIEKFQRHQIFIAVITSERAKTQSNKPETRNLLLPRLLLEIGFRSAGTHTGYDGTGKYNTPRRANKLQ